MSDSEKVLPEVEFGGAKSKKMHGKLDAVQIDSENDSESETETDSDSDLEHECSVCDKRFSGYLPLKQHQKGKKHAKMLLKKKREKKLLDEDAEDKLETDEGESLVPEPYADCKTCDKQFSGPESYRKHLKSRAHRQKVLEASILEKVREKGEINTDKLKELLKSKNLGKAVLENEAGISSLKLKAGGKDEDADEKEDEDEDSDEKEAEFECKDCEKVFSGLKPYIQHLLSKTHGKQLEKKKLLQKVIPEPSKKITTGESKQGHVSTLELEDGILVCKACSTSFSGPESAMAHIKSKNHAKNLEKYLKKLEKRRKKKEAKDLAEKEHKIPPGTDHQEDASAKGEQSADDLPAEPDTPDIPVSDEATNIKPSSDKSEDQTTCEKYKKYKDLMNSLQEENVVLK